LLHYLVPVALQVQKGGATPGEDSILERVLDGVDSVLVPGVGGGGGGGGGGEGEKKGGGGGGGRDDDVQK